MSKQQGHRANFVIDRELWNRARDKARRNNTTVSNLIRVWLTVYTQKD